MDMTSVEKNLGGEVRGHQTGTNRHMSLTSSTSSLEMSSIVKRPLIIPRKVSNALEARGFEVDNNGTVSWAHNSITHHRRWPLLRKVYDSAIICFLEFFMTLISNTGSSMAPEAAKDFGISKEEALFCFTTVYLVGQAMGGPIFPPIAESFGGRTIYLTSTFDFAVFCLVITAWPTLPVVILCRFITGLLSAMPCIVAAGSIENMVRTPLGTSSASYWLTCSTLLVGDDQSNISHPHLDLWSCTRLVIRTSCIYLHHDVVLGMMSLCFKGLAVGKAADKF